MSLNGIITHFARMLSLCTEHISSTGKASHNEPKDRPKPARNVHGFKMQHLTLLSRNPLDLISFTRCMSPAGSKRKIDLTQVERQVGTAVIHATTGKIEKVSNLYY